MECNICGKELREGTYGCEDSPTPHRHYSLRFGGGGGVWVDITVCTSHPLVEIKDWLEKKVEWIDPTERLKEIIKIADKLKWIYPPNSWMENTYPLMQLSDVEKCMIAMVDDFELERMRKWYEEELKKEEIKP